MGEKDMEEVRDCLAGAGAGRAVPKRLQDCGGLLRPNAQEQELPAIFGHHAARHRNLEIALPAHAGRSIRGHHQRKTGKECENHVRND